MFVWSISFFSKFTWGHRCFYVRQVQPSHYEQEWKYSSWIKTSQSKAITICSNIHPAILSVNIWFIFLAIPATLCEINFDILTLCVWCCYKVSSKNLKHLIFEKFWGGFEGKLGNKNQEMCHKIHCQIVNFKGVQKWNLKHENATLLFVKLFYFHGMCHNLFIAPKLRKWHMPNEEFDL